MIIARVDRDPRLLDPDYRLVINTDQTLENIRQVGNLRGRRRKRILNLTNIGVVHRLTIRLNKQHGKNVLSNFR